MSLSVVHRYGCTDVKGGILCYLCIVIRCQAFMVPTLQSLVVARTSLPTQARESTSIQCPSRVSMTSAINSPMLRDPLSTNSGSENRESDITVLVQRRVFQKSSSHLTSGVGSPLHNMFNIRASDTVILTGTKCLSMAGRSATKCDLLSLFSLASPSHDTHCRRISRFAIT